MASVVVFPADLSAPAVVPLDRRVVRFGAASDNDVRLPNGRADSHHAHIIYEKQVFTIAATDPAATVLVNGKKRKSHKLSDGDLIQLGEHVIRFVFYDHGLKTPPSAGTPHLDVSRFNALHRFAEKLTQSWELPDILETLLDELIALTGANKAFLLLVLDGRPQVQTSRNISKAEGGQSDAETVSDSIVQQVLTTGEPLIVADALHDASFKSSLSVMQLRLASVMCVPLKVRGTTLGLFYLGNDNAINHFGDSLLEVVTVFASHAAMILEGALARRELVRNIHDLQTRVSEQRFGEIIGSCDAMRDIYKKIKRVATTGISVLIEGETGTGKELVARAIHESSNRAKGPFIVINCGAIPEQLLESEFFGHTRGAFTGAVATRQGKFQAANGGTLFLDEIGEMAVPLQVKILRAIQERTVVKVGDHRPEKVDIRVVAATNKHLFDEVQQGRFREDLYYRLNVITLDLPPLRERGDDIVLIANYFLTRYSEELVGRDCRLSREAAIAVKRWRWPGNIRELENRIRKAIVFCDGGVITPDNLDLAEHTLQPVLPLAEARDEWQRDYINRVLAVNDGNRTQTARDLDVDPRTIFRHLEKERDN